MNQTDYFLILTFLPFLIFGGFALCLLSWRCVLLTCELIKQKEAITSILRFHVNYRLRQSWLYKHYSVLTGGVRRGIWAVCLRARKADQTGTSYSKENCDHSKCFHVNCCQCRKPNNRERAFVIEDNWSDFTERKN